MHSPHLPRRRALIGLAGCLVGLVGPAVAAPPAPRKVSTAEAREARKLVQAQLDAFAAEDAPRAFSYATPALRQAFDDEAERFMAMVKAEYPQVVRPTSVRFVKVAWIDGTLTQAVQLADQDGAVWLALYQFERQRDKSWRIAGCELFAAEGRMI